MLGTTSTIGMSYRDATAPMYGLEDSEGWGCSSVENSNNVLRPYAQSTVTNK